MNSSNLSKLIFNLIEDCTGSDLFVRSVLFGNVRQAVEPFANVRQHKDRKKLHNTKIVFHALQSNIELKSIHTVKKSQSGQLTWFVDMDLAGCNARSAYKNGIKCEKNRTQMMCRDAVSGDANPMH